MSVLAVVGPFFVLIGLGFLAVRNGWLSEPSYKGISEFAFNFAMPALLFRSIAIAQPGPPGSGRIVLAYFAGIGVIWLAAALLTWIVLRRPAIDAPTIAMTSVFGNIVMIGIPIVFTVSGPEAAAPMAALLSIHTPLLWFAGSLHQQMVEPAQGRSPAKAARDLAADLVKNPLLLAIAGGALWRLGDWPLPKALDTSLALLGQAGIPCAQVALGAGLTRFAIKGQLPTLSSVLVLKLLVMPLAVFYMAVHVFVLPRVAAEVAIIFAAMPAGANAFLFAERSGRVVNSASGAVALGTLLAAATVTLLIAWLRVLVPA